tara:strand:+ start:193 stop:612 length:420 start_codon:yes stop_codon:yes gene_type:complete
MTEEIKRHRCKDARVNEDLLYKIVDGVLSYRFEGDSPPFEIFDPKDTNCFGNNDEEIEFFNELSLLLDPNFKPKEKTYEVLWGMTVATYYKVKASSEDEAIERSGPDYDKDAEWAIDKWEEGYEGSACSYSDIEEVEDD